MKEQSHTMHTTYYTIGLYGPNIICHVSVQIGKYKRIELTHTRHHWYNINYHGYIFTSSSSIIYCLTTTIPYTWVFNTITHTYTMNGWNLSVSRVSVSFCVRDRMELWRTFSHLFQYIFHTNQCTRNLSYTRELFLSWRKINAILILSFICK